MEDEIEDIKDAVRDLRELVTDLKDNFTGEDEEGEIDDFMDEALDKLEEIEDNITTIKDEAEELEENADYDDGVLKYSVPIPTLEDEMKMELLHTWFNKYNLIQLERIQRIIDNAPALKQR
jgi:uncharacterized phage infection (PIP) family protein YhgE